MLQRCCFLPNLALRSLYNEHLFTCVKTTIAGGVSVSLDEPCLLPDSVVDIRCAIL